MTDSSPAPVTPGRPGTPVWVKGLAVAAVLIIVAVVVAMLVLGGQHGPGRHTGSVDTGDHSGWTTSVS